MRALPSYSVEAGGAPISSTSTVHRASVRAITSHIEKDRGGALITPRVKKRQWEAFTGTSFETGEPLE
jgi:hypothetical protein